MQTMPLATSTIEGTSVLSAALAGGLVEEAAPGNEFARLSAELSAGIVNPTLRVGQLAQLASRSVKEAITGVSTQGRIQKLGPEIVTFLNEVAEKLTGWSQEEAVGKSIKQVFNIFRGKSDNNVKESISNLIQITGGKDASDRSILVSRGNQEIPIENTSSPKPENRERR